VKKYFTVCILEVHNLFWGLRLFLLDYGPDTDDWGKLKSWLKGRTDPRVILGHRKSWLAYEGEFYSVLHLICRLRK
jgi:hypothetical protein